MGAWRETKPRQSADAVRSTSRPGQGRLSSVEPPPLTGAISCALSVGRCKRYAPPLVRGSGPFLPPARREGFVRSCRPDRRRIAEELRQDQLAVAEEQWLTLEMLREELDIAKPKTDQVTRQANPDVIVLENLHERPGHDVSAQDLSNLQIGADRHGLPGSRLSASSLRHARSREIASLLTAPSMLVSSFPLNRRCNQGRLSGTGAPLGRIDTSQLFPALQDRP
jgi:hypothetical protein